MPVREGIYGLLAEFDTPGELVAAAKTAYDSGWRRLDCYTPYPLEEAAERSVSTATTCRSFAWLAA